MKHRIIILFLVIFHSFTAFSQFEAQIRESIKHKPKPTFRYDNRNSIISTWGARISSVKFGMEFNDVVTFGCGYEWLGSEIIRKRNIVTVNSGIDTVNSYLKLNYVSAFAEYLFYNDKKWEFNLPISFGLGMAKYSYDYNGTKYRVNQTLVMIYETNMIGYYKIIPWFGIGAGIGYRIMIKGNNLMEENFNSPIYILKLKIYFSEIYNDLLKS